MKKKLEVIYTNEAACRDCYRCIRICPVNAIKMVNDQAQVISEKCIACGICINECPQGAKMYRKDLDKIQLYLNTDILVAFSIAPSFASIFEEWEYRRLPSALREIGAVYVGETAIGAAISANATAQQINENPQRHHICSACPAVVSYIEKYEPSKLQWVTKVVSPMIAHARAIRDSYKENIKVVFVGPCTAKKQEADRVELRNEVDVAITFDELFELFESKNIHLSNCEESAFDEVPPQDARTFPLVGGLLKTAKLDTDSLSANVISVSGVEELKQALQSLDESNSPMIVEPLFCKHGCINGPIGTDAHKSYSSRNKVLRYASSPTSDVANYSHIQTLTKFSLSQVFAKPQFSQDEIDAVLAKTGKKDPSMQLNCSACGYQTCLDQVNAVLQGIAVPEMCMPYMRRLAEQKNDLIIDTDPNGIVILDEKLNIVSMNPAFRKMFFCSDMIIGKRISTLVDPDSFEHVSINTDAVVKKTVKYPQYNLICNQTHFAIKESQQIIGIFDNITDSFKSQGELKKLKVDTVTRAQELIDHQIAMAQEMARFLGESVAEGEMLMNKLINSIDSKTDQ